MTASSGEGMSYRDLRDCVRGFVLENFVLATVNLGDEESLIESGVVDSTGVLELVDFLEVRFGIEVADREFVSENLGSIQRVAAFVERKLASRCPEDAGCHRPRPART